MPMSHIVTLFTMKPQDLHVLLGEIWQFIMFFCDSLLTNQMALSFNIISKQSIFLMQDQTKSF